MSGGRPDGAAGACCDRARIELDEEALRHNIRTLRGMLPGYCSLSAVVKADAYGHGSVPVSQIAQEEGVRHFCAAALDEGIGLRRAGIRGEILVLGPTGPERAEELTRYRLTQTLADAEHAREMSRAVRALGRDRELRVHLSVDTGMHRLGFPAEEPGQAAAVFRMPGLRVTGMFSHLAVPEGQSGEARAFTDRQAERFEAFLEELSARDIIKRADAEHGGYRDAAGRPLTVHLQSSYGFLNRPDLTERFHCGLVRTGIAMYGVKSSPDDCLLLDPGNAAGPDLRPVLSFRARVASVRTVPAGESVGYGMAFTPDRVSRIAVVTAGYADGVPRSLSCGAGTVLVRGRRAPVAGRICMDMFMIDVTDVPGVRPGDTVTLIGRDGPEEITAAETADAAGTIANELLSRLGFRPERVRTSAGHKKTEAAGSCAAASA